MAELVNAVASSSCDGLIGGADPDLITKNIVIVSGAGALVRGTVLGKITVGGKFTKVNSANVDGSQVPKYVLMTGVDATGADVVATVYQSGMFNREYLIFGGTDTADTHEDALRDVNIILTSEK